MQRGILKTFGTYVEYLKKSFYEYYLFERHIGYGI